MSNLAIIALRALIIITAAIALAGQFAILFPIAANDLAQERDYETIDLPLALIMFTLALAAEAILVSLWALLSMVRRGAIFSDRAFRWVDVIIWAGVVTTAVLAVLAVVLVLTVALPGDAPGLIVVSGGLVIAGTAFVLLMIVMRGLLRSATSLHSELAEVV
jgi:hypothetical protein